MHKKWSLYLGSVSGIKIYIHWTFFILIGWIFLMHFRMGQGLSQGLSGTIFVLVLFLCVVLHEFGHAITARRFKIVTRDITVYPIGGIASLESMPSDPRQELQVALAGPAVNLVIALVLWGYLKATGYPDIWPIRPINLSGSSFIPNLLYANIILALFNLIPAFPMDGGRVLRSLLAMKMTHSKATSVAARTGQLLAIGFVFFGFFADFWLVFIGLFIFLGAGAEYKSEEIKHTLEGIRASDVMLSNFITLHSNDTINEASKTLLNSNEKSFVVVDNEMVIGILNYKNIIDGMNAGNPDQKVNTFMQRDFQTYDKDDFLSDKVLMAFHRDQSLFPVISNGKLVGVITPDNLYKWIQFNTRN
ncbi:MAG: site-2 protease family protein [Bacteroidales bacterium]